MPTKTKIIIVVSGGVVSHVAANDPSVQVIVHDADDLDAQGFEDADQLLQTVSEDCQTVATRSSLDAQQQSLRSLQPTQFGTLAFIDEASGVEITGFLSSENSIDQYDPNGPDAGSIPTRYGFKVWQTGGGCTAWRQEFSLDGAPVYMRKQPANSC